MVINNKKMYFDSKYIIGVKRLTDSAKLPQKAYRFDAGWDIFSDEEITISPHTTYAVSTGIAIQLPDVYLGKIFDRSGNALNKGYQVLAGVIDNGYRGEVKVVLLNYTDKSITIKKDEKIAQMVLIKTHYSEVIEVSELVESHRGEKGFGSSG